MRKVLAITALLICMITLSSCSSDTKNENYLGFPRKGFPVVAEQDTHGGFHGDGLSYLILDCSENAEAALKSVENWNALPLPENLSLILYGGERDGVGYEFNVAEKAKIPAIENGYYCFQDRHSEARDASDAEDLFDRASMNFSLALYDSDTNRFYYVEFDT